MKGETQAELFAKVVLGISQGAVDSDFNASLPPRRRSELMRGLQEGVSPSFLPLFYAFLDRACGVLRRENPSLGRLLACETLKTVVASLEWIPIESVVEFKIFSALKEISKWSAQGAEDVQLLAWKCLVKLAGTKQSPGQDPEAWIAELLTLVDQQGLKLPALVPLFSTSDANTMSSVWPIVQANNAQDMSEGLRLHEMHKEVARFVSSVSMTHFTQIWRESGSIANLNSLIAAQVLVLSHPSWSVRKEVIPGVSVLVKSSLLRIAETSATKAKVPTVEASLMLILRLLADHTLMIGKPSSPPKPTWHTAAFTLDDFGDDDSFATAFYAGSASATQIIREISRQRPLVAIRFLLWRIAIACGQTPRPDHPKAMQLDFTQHTSDGSVTRTEPPGMPSRSPSQAFYLSTCASIADAVLVSMPSVSCSPSIGCFC